MGASARQTSPSLTALKPSPAARWSPTGPPICAMPTPGRTLLPARTASLTSIISLASFVPARRPRDVQLAAGANSKKGEALFNKIGCAICHVPTLTTAPAGTKINGGTYTIPAALGSVTSYPYDDFLMHNVGTGDGILQAGP